MKQSHQAILSFTVLFSVMILLTSCFREEEPMVLPPTKGDINVGVAEMTESYEFQVYYSLEKTRTEVRNNIYSWDLCFACTDTAWHVKINNAKTMQAGISAQTEISGDTDPGNTEMQFDCSSGNPDSIALKDAYTGMLVSEYVFIIDCGYDQNYNHLGYKKIKFKTPVNNSYVFEYSDINGENIHNCTIPKNPDSNYQAFSFENGQVNTEPEKKQWDLLFSSYQTMLSTGDGESIPYLVRGVLLNPNNTMAALDTSLNFYDITINDTSVFRFSSRLDFIGHDWKYYNFDDGRYNIIENRNYIIKTSNNYYYKLRFIDFYNEENRKGYPTFEFARL